MYVNYCKNARRILANTSSAVHFSVVLFLECVMQADIVLLFCTPILLPGLMLSKCLMRITIRQLTLQEE